MICPHCRLEDRGGLHTAEFCIEILDEIIRRVPVTGGMILPRSNVNHEAYRRGLCCDCSAAPYSAGRPRCAPCHDGWTRSQPTFDPGLRRGQPGVCGVTGCSNPAVPGAVRCGPCARAEKKPNIKEIR